MLVAVAVAVIPMAPHKSTLRKIRWGAVGLSLVFKVYDRGMESGARLYRKDLLRTNSTEAFDYQQVIESFTGAWNVPWYSANAYGLDARAITYDGSNDHQANSAHRLDLYAFAAGIAFS